MCIILRSVGIHSTIDRWGFIKLSPLAKQLVCCTAAVPLVANHSGAQAEGPSAAEENLYCINRLAYIEGDDGKKTEGYDLDSPENVQKYWAALEDAALEMGAGRRGEPLASSRLSSFPFDRAPEVRTFTFLWVGVQNDPAPTDRIGLINCMYYTS